MVTTDKRVQFDFEIDFSNGGGIQGQGFRLDIRGEDIPDDVLAEHLIAEMNLLMVGQVRILNKSIIEERHKRPCHRDSEAPLYVSRYVDLSHDIENGMITYKGIPAPLVCDHLSHEQSKADYEGDTSFHFARIDMVTNTGTYIDTPYHRFENGYDLTDLPLQQVSNIEGIVVNVAGQSARAIDWAVFAPIDIAGKAILIHTGWDKHWRTDKYFEGHPYLTEQAASFLRDKGAKIVGIDSLNIDNTEGGIRPVHTILLEAGIPIIEHLTHLEELPASGFRFSAIPPKIQKVGTFPVRAHGFVPANMSKQTRSGLAFHL